MVEKKGRKQNKEYTSISSVTYTYKWYMQLVEIISG